MRSILAVSAVALLTLSACDPRPQSQIDPAAFLGKLMEDEGPEVSGVNAALLDSARQAEEKKQYARAIQFYQQLLDSEKDNPVFVLGLADNLRRVGQFDEATARYGAVLVKQPDNIDAMEGKGLCLLSKGDFDGAHEQLRQVMAKEEGRWRTLNAIGILFVMNEKPQEAMSYYDQALKVKPDEAAVLNNAGLTLAMVQDYPNAIDALTRAGSKLAEGDPQKKRADLNLALIYGLSGDMDMAEQVAKKHLKEAALNNNLGFYAYLADNRDLAKAYLNNAVSGSPVFYEKAWKNLETVAGSHSSGNRNGFTRKGKHSPHVQNDAMPFTVYPPEQETPEQAVAAPVAAVTSGQDMEALVLENEDNTKRSEESVSLPAMPVADPKAAEIPHVEVFPAVPVKSMMEAGIKPVVMPVTPDLDKKDELPPVMPPAAMAVAAPDQKAAIREISDEASKPLKASKIMEKIRSVQQADALPAEMGSNEITTAEESLPPHLKDARAAMIIYQAKPEEKTSEVPSVPAEEVPASGEAGIPNDAADTKVREAEAATAPAAAEQHPVERKSALDVIKQIF